MRSGNLYTNLLHAVKKVKGTKLMSVVLLCGFILFSAQAFAQPATWYSDPSVSVVMQMIYQAGGTILWDFLGDTRLPLPIPEIPGTCRAAWGAWVVVHEGVAGTLNIGAGSSGVSFSPTLATINVGGDLNVTDDASFNESTNTTINVTGNLIVANTATFNNFGGFNFIHFNNTGSSFGSPQKRLELD